MDRLVQHNVLAMSGRAVEAAGDVNTLLLDKTGTITLGIVRLPSSFPLPGVTEAELADAAQLASLADETPEGRSIVVLAKETVSPARTRPGRERSAFVPFTAQTRMSGVNLDGRESGKARPTPSRNTSRVAGGACRRNSRCWWSASPRSGGTPLVVADATAPLGVIHLKDVVKGGMRGAIRRLARHGHQDGHDYGRQSADGRGHRPGGRRR